MFTILMYHQIAELPPQQDPLGLAITPALFERQMRYLKQRGYACLTVGSAAQALRAGRTLPRKTLALTFDDGFEDVYTTVWPILRHYEYPATIFPVAGCVGGHSDWPGQDGDQTARLLSWAQLKELVEHGFEVGSHTLTHPRLAQLDPAQVEDEVRRSKQVLEERLGIRIEVFSYPFSSQTPDVQRIVAASGYLGACSGERGRWNRFNLWRASCWRDEHPMAFALKAGGWYHRMIWLREETAAGPPLRRVVRTVKRLSAGHHAQAAHPHPSRPGMEAPGGSAR